MDATTPARAPTPATHRPWYTILYIQVLIAIGVLVGYFFPDAGKAMKPLGDAFIELIRMMIAPLIFCTVVHGIASMSDLKKVGRIGVKIRCCISRRCRPSRWRSA
jgi:aerobic C4-dicarboxylate transport protein